jgi:hypothetical protein
MAEKGNEKKNTILNRISSEKMQNSAVIIR